MSFQSQIPKAEIPQLSAGSLLQTLSQQGAIPTSLLMAGLIPQTARVSLSHRHVCGKPDVLVCVSGTALGHCSQTLPWPNCTDVGGAAIAQGCAFFIFTGADERGDWYTWDHNYEFQCNEAFCTCFPLATCSTAEKANGSRWFWQPEGDSSPLTSAWRSSTREGCGSELRPSLPGARPLSSLHLMDAFCQSHRQKEQTETELGESLKRNSSGSWWSHGVTDYTTLHVA